MCRFRSLCVCSCTTKRDLYSKLFVSRFIMERTNRPPSKLASELIYSRHTLGKAPFWKRPQVFFTLGAVKRVSVGCGSAGWSVSVSKIPGILPEFKWWNHCNGCFSSRSALSCRSGRTWVMLKWDILSPEVTQTCFMDMSVMWKWISHLRDS